MHMGQKECQCGWHVQTNAPNKGAAQQDRRSNYCQSILRHRSVACHATRYMANKNYVLHLLPPRKFRCCALSQLALQHMDSKLGRLCQSNLGATFRRSCGAALCFIIFCAAVGYLAGWSCDILLSIRSRRATTATMQFSKAILH